MNRPDFYHTRDLIIGWPSKESLDKKDDRLNPHLSNPNFSVPILGYEGREFPLFTQIQIQTIEFCNLKCDFCPNHYLIWDRLDDKKKGIPYNLMSIENYTKLMKNL